MILWGTMKSIDYNEVDWSNDACNCTAILASTMVQENCSSIDEGKAVDIYLCATMIGCHGIGVDEDAIKEEMLHEDLSQFKEYMLLALQGKVTLYLLMYGDLFVGYAIYRDLTEEEYDKWFDINATFNINMRVFAKSKEEAAKFAAKKIKTMDLTNKDFNISFE